MAVETPRVYVFYDYVCPYAYIGKLRADALQRAYDVGITYLPWEIHADTNPAGEPYDKSKYDGTPASNWVDELAAEVGGELNGPSVGINSNLALRGAEYAKDQGGDHFERYHNLAFEAVWTDGQNLGDPEVLAGVVKGAGLEPDAFFDGVSQHAYQYRLDLIDEFAEELGIQRVPTFVFGDQRVVGNDRFEPSLKVPLEAFLERHKVLGEDGTTTLEDDTGLWATL